MQTGRERLSSGQLYASMNYFIPASKDAPSVADSAEAMRMIGVTFRKQGNLDMALEHGRNAMHEAIASQQPQPISGAARDLAATLHALGVFTAKDRAANLREALALYVYSLEQDRLARQKPFDDTAEPGAQYSVTLGMKALLLYDMAHYRIWINDDGSEPARLYRHEAHIEKRRAIGMLREAYRQLRGNNSLSWQLNNLLKFIQVAPRSEKRGLMDEARHLLVHYPHRANEVRIARLGRRAMRLALKLKVMYMHIF